MKKRMVLPLTAVLAVAGFAGSVFANQHEGQEFMAEMTPEQQSAEVESNASGDAQIQFSEDGSSLEYTINAQNLENTLSGHFHSAPPGQDGPVELALLENEQPTDYNGEVVSGTLTEADLAGDMSWDEFTEALVAGDIYVNLHTEKYPGGEIRGQVVMAGEGDEMATTASNGPLYAMLGMLMALVGGAMFFGQRAKKTN